MVKKHILMKKYGSFTESFDLVNDFFYSVEGLCHDAVTASKTKVYEGIIEQI